MQIDRSSNNTQPLSTGTALQVDTHRLAQAPKAFVLPSEIISNMDVAVESAYHESENEEEDIFGDSVQPASAAEDEEMDLFGEEARPAASTLER